MFPCFKPLRLLPAIALGVATQAAGEARADLTQTEYEVPALDAQDEPIEDCNLLLTMQFDPEQKPAAGLSRQAMPCGRTRPGRRPSRTTA